MEKTLRVSILGRPYPLRVRADDEAFTLRVAALVDERIRAVEQQAPGHPDLTHAIIAALSLGEDLLSALEDLEAARAELQAAHDAAASTGRPILDFDPAALRADADALADRLEAALGGGGDGAAVEGDLPEASPPTGPRKGAAPPANPEGGSAVRPYPAAGSAAEVPDPEAPLPPPGDDDPEAGADSPLPKTP